MSLSSQHNPSGQIMADQIGNSKTQYFTSPLVLLQKIVPLVFQDFQEKKPLVETLWSS